MSIEGQIKEMLQSAFTYTEMAKKLEVTKGTISGKIARMRARGEIDYLYRPVIMRAEPEDPISRMIVAYERLTLRVTVEGRHVPPPANCEGVHLLDLNAGDCRFAVSRNDAGHFFCGKPRRDAKTSYCADHHAMVWVKRPGGPKKPFEFRSQKSRRFGDVL
jgi:hypothetical protein